MRALLLSALLASVYLVGGCASLEDVDETADWSADRFYSEAKRALATNNNERAIELFDKLQARYPFGRYAQQAQLELIYTYYRSGTPDQALAAADRFIRTHPRHPFVDYAYYMKGLTNFDRGVGVLERLFPRDPAKTDTRSALQAFNDFSELVQKFPDSSYREDATRRMLFLRNSLARYEVNVARFYLRRQAYVAAANRAKYVLENFSSTPAVADALALMVRAYVELDAPDLAMDSARVLQASYPDSPQFAEISQFLQGQPLPPMGDNDRALLGLNVWIF